MSTAILLFVANEGVWPVACFAYVPWIRCVHRSRCLSSLVQSSSLALLFGCGVASWVPAQLQELGASGFGANAWLVMTVAWARVPFLLAFGLAVWWSRRGPLAVAIGVPTLVFAAGEVALSKGWIGIPWALLGHSQASCPGVAQLAVVGGVPSIGALLVAINLAIASRIGELRFRAGRVAWALTAAWLALAGGGLWLAEVLRHLEPAAEPALRFLVVQPDLPRGERWNASSQRFVLERMARATERGLSTRADRPTAVVWPENVLTVAFDGSLELRTKLFEHVDGWGTPLLTGVVRSASADVAHRERYRSSVVWIAPGRGVVASQDKVRAVPILEGAFEGLPARLATLVLGDAAIGPRVDEGIEAGALRADFSLSVTLCYEALFPDLVAARRDGESVALFQLADDSWTDDERVSRALVSTARFRAIEERIHLVRVAHGGPSLLVDPFGRSVVELPKNTYAQGWFELFISPPPSWIERLGLLALPAIVAWSVWHVMGSRWLARPRQAADRLPVREVFPVSESGFRG